MQPVPTEVQHHTDVPKKYADLDGVVWSISQAILCVFSKYYGRLNCSESWITFFSRSSDVSVALNYASLSRYSIKVPIFWAHSNQNKPYPSLCVKPTSPHNQKYNNTNTPQKDFCFRIKVRFSDVLWLG